MSYSSWLWAVHSRNKVTKYKITWRFPLARACPTKFIQLQKLYLRLKIKMNVPCLTTRKCMIAMFMLFSVISLIDLALHVGCDQTKCENIEKNGGNGTTSIAQKLSVEKFTTCTSQLYTNCWSILFHRFLEGHIHDQNQLQHIAPMQNTIAHIFGIF